MVWSDCQHFSFIFLGLLREGLFCMRFILLLTLPLIWYYTLYMEKEGTYAKVRSKQDNTNQPPYPVADMKYHLIHLTSFATFPSRGRLSLRGISAFCPHSPPIPRTCLPRFFGCAMMKENANPFVCRSPASGGTVHDPCSQCGQHAYYHRRLSG